MNYRNIKVDAVGKDKLRLSSPSPLDGPVLEKFVRDLQHLAWEPKPDSPAARVFYISAADAANILNPSEPKSGRSAAGSEPGMPATGEENKPESAETSDGSDLIKEDNAATDSQAKIPNAQKSSASDARGKSSISAKDNGSEKTPATGDSKQGRTASTPAQTVTKPANENTGSSKTSAEAVPSIADVVLFTDVGDDALVTEKKRLLAAIDYPRPEVIVDAWTFQTSSSDPESVQLAQARLRRATGNFNQVIQDGIYRAWAYLQGEIAKPKYFNDEFYDYVVPHYIADSRSRLDIPNAVRDATAVDAASSEGPAILEADRRNTNGVCADYKYCLGYTTLFRPLRPSLTDMLFAVIASNKPNEHLTNALGDQGSDESKSISMLRGESTSSNQVKTRLTTPAHPVTAAKLGLRPAEAKNLEETRKNQAGGKCQKQSPFAPLVGARLAI